MYISFQIRDFVFFGYILRSGVTESLLGCFILINLELSKHVFDLWTVIFHLIFCLWYSFGIVVRLGIYSAPFPFYWVYCWMCELEVSFSAQDRYAHDTFQLSIFTATQIVFSFSASIGNIKLSLCFLEEEFFICLFSSGAQVYFAFCSFKKASISLDTFLSCRKNKW